jgi:hypothetical protein
MDLDEREIERQTQLRVSLAIDRLPELVGEAVERAVRRAMADEKLRADFWAAGYKELEKHAGTSISQALGRRMWNLLLTAAIGAVLAWSVITGRVK